MQRVELPVYYRREKKGGDAKSTVLKKTYNRDKGKYLHWKQIKN